jgi:hypothetical protein
MLAKKRTPRRGGALKAIIVRILVRSRPLGLWLAASPRFAASALVLVLLAIVLVVLLAMMLGVMLLVMLGVMLGGVLFRAVTPMVVGSVVIYPALAVARDRIGFGRAQCERRRDGKREAGSDCEVAHSFLPVEFVHCGIRLANAVLILTEAK